MAIAELSQALASSTDGDLLRGDVDVRVDVHDASRLEWAVTVPLPATAWWPSMARTI